MADTTPALTMEEITASLSQAQKSQLHEVADGMLKIYMTLVRMRYLDESWIVKAPYASLNTRLLPMWQSFNLDPAVIYLYSILPYVTNSGHLSLDFFQGGQFADFRIKSVVQENRNPFYYDDEESMPPHMTTLSSMGNHVGIILYDAKRHRIGLFDQMSDCNWDYVRREEQDSRPRGAPKPFEHDSDPGEYGELMKEGREAGPVLRDIVKWYEELRETPGGGELSHNEWDRELVMPLYLKHGWPGPNFDGEAFLIDRVRARQLERAKYRAEEPLREVKCYKGWLALRDYDDSEFDKLKKKVEEARTVDEEWSARWDLQSLEKRKWQNEKELAEAEALAREKCPGGKCWRDEDLPIMELRQVATEYCTSKNHLENERKLAESVRSGKRERYRGMKAKLHQTEQRLEIARKAYEASKSDAERLCPSHSLSFLPMIENHGYDVRSRLKSEKESVKNCQSEIQEILDWIGQLPDEAETARKKAQESIDAWESSMEFMKRRVEWYEKIVRELDEEEQRDIN